MFLFRAIIIVVYHLRLVCLPYKIGLLETGCYEPLPNASQEIRVK